MKSRSGAKGDKEVEVIYKFIVGMTRRVLLMNRNDIAKAIAEDLLNNGTLDENNFNYDTDALLEYVQEIILEHIKEFSLLSGAVF